MYILYIIIIIKSFLVLELHSKIKIKYNIRENV